MTFAGKICDDLYKVASIRHLTTGKILILSLNEVTGWRILLISQPIIYAYCLQWEIGQLTYAQMHAK